MDDGSFERGGLSDKGESRAGQNLYLLDAYLDYDGEVGDMPFTIRAGRQVINWGEATFIPGGNSAFSPIDVAAIRRPGAEIKECPAAGRSALRLYRPDTRPDAGSLCRRLG